MSVHCTAVALVYWFLMAKKKKEKQPGLFSEVRPETGRTVAAVVFLLSGIVLLASSFGAAGALGSFISTWMRYLIGVGFYILPAVLFLLSLQKFRPLPEESSSTKRLKTVTTVCLIVLALALLELISRGLGGVAGGLLAAPLVALSGTLIALVLVIGVMIVSALLLFDAHVHFDLFSLFKRTERTPASETAPAETNYFDEDAEEGEEDEDAEESEVEPDDEETEEEIEEEPSPTPRSSAPLDESGIVMAPATQESYTPPPLTLLSRDKKRPEVGDTKANANIIKRTLANFGITVEMDEITVGPTVTRYALKPAEGVRISRIVGLQGNLELALSGASIRIEAPIPGKSLIGIEVPNHHRATIGLHYLLADEQFQTTDKPLLAALGRDITGAPHYLDIAKMPHGLIAGTTGSGKSVVLHSLLTSLLYRNGPGNLRLMIIDPKRTEFSSYDGIPHMITPVITEPKKAILALKWAMKEMDRRNEVLQAEHQRNIADYHQHVLAPARKEFERRQKKGEQVDPTEVPEALPYIVIAIDEMADLMTSFPRELEASIVRLAQVGRAAGVHLVLATQRPSVNVITGTIKANIPTRIALNVPTQIDSRTILDAAGAEKLQGAGDMLYLGSDTAKPIRIQSAFISSSETAAIVAFLKKHNDPTLHETIDLADAGVSLTEGGRGGGGDGEEDPLYEDAKAIIIEAQKAATSFLQRKLGIGYARAAKLIDLLEENGVVGPGNGAKARDVLIKPGSVDVMDDGMDEIDALGSSNAHQGEEHEEDDEGDARRS